MDARGASSTTGARDGVEAASHAIARALARFARQIDVELEHGGPHAAVQVAPRFEPGRFSAPLVVDSELFGWVRARGAHELTADERSLVQDIVDLGAASVAQAWARDVERVSATRNARLQQIADSLASTVSISRVAQVILQHAVEALGAQSGVVLLLDRTGTTLELVRSRGLGAEAQQAWQRQRADVSTPLSDSLKRREPVFLESHAEHARQYPVTLTPHVAPAGARAALPLLARGRPIGVLAFAWDGDRHIDGAQRELAVALAHQCSISLERCLMFRDETAARRRTSSLQRLTATLASARGLDDVADRLVAGVTSALGCPAAWLAVVDSDRQTVSVVHTKGKVSESRWRRFPIQTPGPIHDVIESAAPLLFADWCSIEMLGPGGDAQTRLFVHRNPEKVALGRELRRRQPSGLDGPVNRVVRTGRSEAFYVIDDDVLKREVPAEHLQSLQALGIRSALVVPLATGGSVSGR
jgi:GAF domain-containing protein